MRLLILGLALLTMNVNAAEAFKTGQELREECGDNSGFFMRGACYGFITAVFDLHSSWVESGVISEPQFCKPPKVTLDKLKSVITAYMDANPDDLDKTASGNVLNAFAQAFPCE